MIAYHKIPAYAYMALAEAGLKEEKECNEHMLGIILAGESPKCPVCGSIEPYIDKKHLGIYKCKNQECRNSFSAYHDTFLYGTKVPFRKWLALICTFFRIGKEFKITMRAYAIGLKVTSPTVKLMMEKIYNDEKLNRLAHRIYTKTNVGLMRRYLDEAWRQLDEVVKKEQKKRRKQP